MAKKPTRRPKRRSRNADRQLAEKVIALLQLAKDVINDPATPDETVQKVGAIIEAFRYQRPPFTRHISR